jgi:predicted membrane metal-binding protein
MLRWLLLIVLSSCFFFIVPPPAPRSGGQSKAPTPLAREHFGLRLARGLTFGDYGILTKRELAPYRSLGLLHLFTPSGLQLSALNNVFPKSGRFAILKFFLFFTMLSIYLAPHDYFAIKRMALWNVLRQGKIFSTLFNVDYWPSVHITFLLAFVIDYFWGTWIHSPLSFCYSFLFAGCFLLLGTTPRLLWPLGLVMAYGILGEFRGEQLSLLAIPASLVLTFFFNPIVLYCLLGVLLHLLFETSFILRPLTILHQIIEIFAGCADNFPLIRPNLIWTFTALFFLELFPFRPTTKSKTILLIMGLALMPNQVLNIPAQSMRLPRMYEMRAINKSVIKSIRHARLHSHVVLSTGEHCQLRFTSTVIYLQHCHYKKRRTKKN